MKEKIYCPKCDKSNIKTMVGERGGTKSEGEMFAEGMKNTMFGLAGTLISSQIRNADGEYFPITYHCLECGHTFLSMETNLEEHRRACKSRMRGIVITAFGAIILALAAIIAIQTPDSGKFLAIVVGVIALAFGVFGIDRLQESNKAIKRLEEERDQIEQCALRHKPLY